MRLFEADLRSETGLTISQFSGVWSTSSRSSVVPHPVMIPCSLGRSGWEFSGRQIGLRVTVRRILVLRLRPDVRILVPRDWLLQLQQGDVMSHHASRACKLPGKPVVTHPHVLLGFNFKPTVQIIIDIDHPKSNGDVVKLIVSIKRSWGKAVGRRHYKPEIGFSF